MINATNYAQESLVRGYEREEEARCAVKCEKKDVIAGVACLSYLSAVGMLSAGAALGSTQIVLPAIVPGIMGVAATTALVYKPQGRDDLSDCVSKTWQDCDMTLRVQGCFKWFALCVFGDDLESISDESSERSSSSSCRDAILSGPSSRRTIVDDDTNQPGESLPEVPISSHSSNFLAINGVNTQPSAEAAPQ